MSNNPDSNFKSFLRCTSFCTADGYDILGIASFFKKKGYLTRISRDVLHVTNSKRSGDIFLFNHGCFVSWGFKKNFEEKVLIDIAEYSLNRNLSIETDHFHYYYGEPSSMDTHERTRQDVIVLESQDAQEKLAISYGLAQSIKLESFEEAIKDAIKKHNYLPGELASHGSVSLTRRAIFKRMGEIFLARSSINLNIEFLDIPEFFWRNPSLEPNYNMVKKFLDIPSRVMALNQKLDVLQELLDMLNAQVMHRHSSLLESIIILLIVVEIIISLFQFHMA
jgi:uncharacterized Rmd1/YagE family protein